MKPALSADRLSAGYVKLNKLTPSRLGSPGDYRNSIDSVLIAAANYTCIDVCQCDQSDPLVCRIPPPKLLNMLSVDLIIIK